jgi:hypothetical protein
MPFGGRAGSARTSDLTNQLGYVTFEPTIRALGAQERPRLTRTLSEMARRALPALLALLALIADFSGSHAVALAFLLGAIPAAFALALECYGDALESRCGGLRPLTAAVGVALLVLSAALRSPAVVGGVPRLAVTAVVLCPLLYAGWLLGALFVPRPVAAVRPEEELDRLAA